MSKACIEAIPAGRFNQFGLSGEVLDICEWSLITVTYNGSEVCIYSNGRMVKKESATGSPTITTGNLNIGLADGKTIYLTVKWTI